MKSGARNRLLTQYARGWFTPRETAVRLVEETNTLPTTEFVASLPVVVLELVREQAAETPTTDGIRIVSCNASDYAAWEATQRELQSRWRAGIVLWREYFGFNAEQQT